MASDRKAFIEKSLALMTKFNEAVAKSAWEQDKKMTEIADAYNRAVVQVRLEHDAAMKLARLNYNDESIALYASILFREDQADGK